jgi:hypothetical protein
MHVFIVLVSFFIYYTVEGNGHPIMYYEDTEGEERYSFNLSLKPMLDPGKWPTPRLGRFATGKHQVPVGIYFCQFSHKP